MASRSRSAMLAAAVICLVGALAGACGDSAGRSSPDLGPWQYQTLDGASASLEALQGKPVVVNFFASWCTPCRLEMPELERVHAKLGDRVQFVGLNLQEDATRANDIVANTKVTYSIGLDREGAIYRSFGGLTMPTTVLLDAKGTVVNVHGGSLDTASLTKLIADKLGVT